MLFKTGYHKTHCDPSNFVVRPCVWNPSWAVVVFHVFLGFSRRVVHSRRASMDDGRFEDNESKAHLSFRWWAHTHTHKGCFVSSRWRTVHPFSSGEILRVGTSGTLLIFLTIGAPVHPDSSRAASLLGGRSLFLRSFSSSSCWMCPYHTSNGLCINPRRTHKHQQSKLSGKARQLDVLSVGDNGSFRELPHAQEAHVGQYHHVDDESG